MLRAAALMFMKQNSVKARERRHTMKILALNGSIRKYGNTEILVKQALMGAESKGAEVEILKLTDCNILPCRGCGLCLFKDNVCQVKDDDVKLIFSKLDECDGLILGAPCYYLELTAIVKQLLDRCWILSHKYDKKQKPATIIVPYATRGWIPYIFVQSHLLLKCTGFTKINEAAICTQGISEVVLDQDAMDLAFKMGEEIALAVRDQDFSYRGDPGICPSCHDRNLRILRDNKNVECPTCGIRGKLSIVDEKIKVDFEETALLESRLRQDVTYNHFTYHIAPSKNYFTRTKDERKAKTKIYAEYLKGQGDTYDRILRKA
jgi:multimeric flavodoxin WrbA